MLEKILKYLLFSTPAVLLVVPYSMFFPFISGKNLLFRLCVEIALGLYLFLIVKNKEYRPKKSPILLSVLFFVGIVFFADLFSPNFSKAFWSNFERSEGFVTILHLFIYFIILGSVLRTRELWNKFFVALMSVSVALNFFGWLQYTGGIQVNQSTTRLDSLMGNSAYFAGFLMFQIFIFLFFFKRERNNIKYFSWILFLGSVLFSLVYVFNGVFSTKGWVFVLMSLFVGASFLKLSYLLKDRNSKILLGIISVLILVSHISLTYLTQTRGALLGLIGGLFIGALIISTKEKNKILQKTALATIVTILFIVIGFIFIRNTDFVKNNEILSRFAGISWSERNTQARQIIWPMAFEGIKERPILGWGQEGFNYVFSKYYNPELWRHEAWFDRTHNVFIDWFVASGLFGFLSYIMLYVVSLIIIVKKIFKRSVTEGAILMGLIVGYAFQNMFIFDNLGSYILFFSLLGFLHFENDGEKEISDLNIKKQKNTDEDVNPIFVAIASGFVALCFIYFFVFNPYSQNTNIIKGLSPQKLGPEENLRIFREAFSYGGSGVSESLDQFYSVTQSIINAKGLDMKVKLAFFEEAGRQFGSYEKVIPLEVKPLYSFGVFLGQVGQLDISLRYLEKAIILSPKKIHILNQIGLVYLVKGDKENSMKYLKRSYDLAPEYNDSEMLYASALFINDKKGESFSILEKFANEGVIPIPFLSDLLIKNGFKIKLISLINTAEKVNPSENNRKLLESLTK